MEEVNSEFTIVVESDLDKYELIDFFIPRDSRHNKSELIIFKMRKYNDYNRKKL